MLKSRNIGSLAQIFSLARLSLESLKEITQESKGREWESSSRVLGQFNSKESKRIWLKGYGGVFILLTLKTSRCPRVTRRVRVFLRILRRVCPDIPGWNPDTPGSAAGSLKTDLCKIFDWFLWLTGFAWVSWALDPSHKLQIKIPLDITAILYSNLKQIQILESIPKHRFSIPFYGNALHHLFH